MSEDYEMDAATAVQVIQPAAMQLIERAGIDAQVATANAYPRQLNQVMSYATELATVDPDTAAQCNYRLKKGGSVIEGPSVRLAEIMASAWKHIRTQVYVEVNERDVVARAVAHDMQQNVAFGTEVRRGIMTSPTKGEQKRYGDDMINTTCNAAAAIALRNAVFKVVPRSVVNIIAEKAKAVARGDEKSLETRRKAAMAWFKKEGAKERDVFFYLGVDGVEEIGLDELQTLNELRQAIIDKETTLAEAFAPAPEVTTETQQEIPA